MSCIRLLPYMLEERLRNLDRAGELSLTQQLVAAFVTAIEQGEFAAGAKLPPTRSLAELAGVNQLTAGRVYRRLAQMGLVGSGVGRGTFVRETAPLHGGGAGALGGARGARRRRDRELPVRTGGGRARAAGRAGRARASSRRRRGSRLHPRDDRRAAGAVRHGAGDPAPGRQGRL